MNRLIAMGVRNPIFVNILLTLTMVGGAMASWLLIKEMFPRFSLDNILIQVPYPGAGPEEVEEGISLKLEDALEGIEGVKNVFTTAEEFVGIARVEVEESADIVTVKDEVTDAVNAITTFPADAERPIIREVKFNDPVLSIAVYGEVPEGQLKELAEQIKDDLLRAPEISQVSLSGVRPYEISIEVSETKLRQYGLTIEDVSRVVRQASQNFPGGTVRSEAEQIKIRTMGRRYRGMEYGEIVLLANPDGTSIRLDQVATIRDAFQEDEIVGRFNQKPCVLIDVRKAEEEDALAIAERVNQFIEAKQKELPPTVNLQRWADSSKFISDRLNLLIRNGRLGLILVFLLLWVFLDLRLAFWCSMGIPISLAGALIIMGMTGQSLNMISLFGLIMILGIIVDDAIVVGEAIYVQRRRGLPPRQAAIAGAREVAWPVFAAVVTTIIAFLPLMFIGGIMGKFIRVLPMVVIAALIFSLVEGLFMLPTHLRKLPNLDLPTVSQPGFRNRLRRIRYNMSHSLEWVSERIYLPMIRRVLDWRYVTLAVAIATLLISVGFFQAGIVKFQFFPKVDTDFVFAQVEFPNGTPLEVTRKALARIEAEAHALEDQFETPNGADLVELTFSLAGAGFGNEPSVGSHVGAVLVELLPTEERRIHYTRIQSQWEENVGVIPGALAVTFEVPQAGPGGKAIEIWLLGRDLQALRNATEEVKARLAEFDGVFQIEDDFRPGKRELRVRLKPEARNLGLTAAEIGSQLRRAFYGEEALRVQRGRDEVKVWIRYPQAERRSLAEIENMYVRTAGGEQVPLLTVADVQLEQGYSRIIRKNGQRRIAVFAEIDPTRANSEEILGYMRETFFEDLMARYPGMYVSVEGQAAETRESFTSLKIGFPLAMMGIFLILATMFGSYIQPLVIMVTIPFGLIGALFGHLLMGYDMTMLSMFGMVALTGIVVNDAIVLIECVNDRIRHGVPVQEALALGGARRFRAIVLTTLTTCLGLAPLIAERSMQAQFLIPMAISIAAGVLFASVLTLVLAPCLLLILSDLRRVWFWMNTGQWVGREQVEPLFMEKIRAESSPESTDETLELV